MTIFLYEHLTALAGAGTSLAREGQAMFEAVRADFQALPDVQIRSVRTAAREAFRRQSARCDFTLAIAPETDGLLESRCRWTEQAGGRSLGSSASAVQLCADKLALFEHLTARGIPTPRCWPVDQEPDRFPLVWKPRDGAGSQFTYLIKSPAKLAAARRQAKASRAMIAQEFAPGFAASVAVLVGAHSQTALAPCSQKLSRDGRFRYLGGEAPLDPAPAERAMKLALRAVASVPGLFGYVGVDLVLGARARGDRVIEINPRLTTSYVGLRQLADFNIAEMMLRIAQGQPLPRLRWRPRRVAFTPAGVCVCR